MSLIEELAEELDRGKIYEATLISDDGAHIHGLCDYTTGSITVDPKVAIVSTLLHELIHRKHPEWSEQRVARAEIRALNQLSQKDVLSWYRRYRRAVRKRRPVDAS